MLVQREDGQNKNFVQCHYCWKYGYIEKNCYKTAVNNTNSKNEKSTSEENLFVAYLVAKKCHD